MSKENLGSIFGESCLRYEFLRRRSSTCFYSGWQCNGTTQISEICFLKFWNTEAKYWTSTEIWRINNGLTYSSILAWRILWTGEPGGLQSTASQRVGHDWSNLRRTQLTTLKVERARLWGSIWDSHCIDWGL